MSTFTYHGRNAEGKSVSGERVAETAEEVGTQLIAMGIIPITIEPFVEKPKIFSNLFKSFGKAKISTAELTLFTRQMYTLVKSGIPISTAMKQLSVSTRNEAVAKIFLDIAEKLEGGQELASAMANYPEIFPPLVISMVQIGQTTGDLDKAFLRLSEYLELEGGTVRRMKSAIRYPVFVILTIIVGIIIINVFVIPAFAGVYERANIPLPLITMILIKMSNFMRHNWAILFIIISLIIAAIVRYVRTPSGRYKFDKFMFKLPVIGYLLRRMTLLRFTSTFSIIVNSGVPIIQGLQLVSEAMENQYARVEIAKMKDAIQRGSSVYNAATQCALFTSLELQMLSISEKTGELGTLLGEIAQYYQREVDYDLKHITDIIEPLLLSAIGIMVLFLALAVYMPIWNMIKLAHQ